MTHDQLREGANDQLYGGWPMILSGLKTWLETGELLTTPGSLMSASRHRHGPRRPRALHGPVRGATLGPSGPSPAFATDALSKVFPGGTTASTG